MNNKNLKINQIEAKNNAIKLREKIIFLLEETEVLKFWQFRYILLKKNQLYVINDSKKKWDFDMLIKGKKLDFYRDKYCEFNNSLSSFNNILINMINEGLIDKEGKTYRKGKYIDILFLKYKIKPTFKKEIEYIEIDTDTLLEISIKKLMDG